MPLIEAFVVGTPTACSNVNSLPEQAVTKRDFRSARNDRDCRSHQAIWTTMRCAKRWFTVGVNASVLLTGIERRASFARTIAD